MKKKIITIEYHYTRIYVMCNLVHGAFKLYRFSQGDVVLHNTVIKVGAGMSGNQTMNYAYFRNNLAIGGPDGGVNWGDYGAGSPSVAYIPEPGKYRSLDYDAVGVYGIDYIATICDQPFSEVEKHDIEKITIDGVFTNVEFPDPPVPERKVLNSREVDAVVIIPNENDKYKGEAPDCDSYESGQELPHYGPRKY